MKGDPVVFYFVNWAMQSGYWCICLVQKGNRVDT